MLTREASGGLREATATREATEGPGGEQAPAAEAPATWHGAVRQFKRQLLERALASAGGNRTHAARALALQRTYLLRLLRTLDVSAPPRLRTQALRRAADRFGGACLVVASAATFPGQRMKMAICERASEHFLRTTSKS